ncbi:Dna2-domain-containing protein [Pluteus cervinus]|uniref:Dna2-domain-containing protein n=1 Tax=Pluteus cervinus TaxID=181527 RepID=A0ACD3ARE1_9AGAR|nr:Dna2-domain-containing protein [Pluteus cervinus]
MPPPTTRDAADETSFMAGLLHGLDETFWDASLTPDSSPVKTKFKPLPVHHGKHSQPHSGEQTQRIAVTKQLTSSFTKDPGSGSLSANWNVPVLGNTRDTVNVLGAFKSLPSTSSRSSPTSFITISSKENFIILHPDLLVTATALSNSAQCVRRPLLSSLIRSSSDATPSMLWGNMLHEVTQACLREGQWEESWIVERIDEAIQDNLADLDAQREVLSRAKGLQGFFERYIADTPKPNAFLENTRAVQVEPSLLAISSLIDVEEDIWSPKYGIKGKIDATVHGIISDPPPLRQQAPHKADKVVSSGPFPLELKTGLATKGMEHRAQTMLYTLLLSERYGVDVSSGLLFYTQKDEVVRVPRVRNEIRGLMTSRNEIAAYMMRRMKPSHRANAPESSIEDEPFLPPTIDDERLCKRCYAVNTCMLYRKAVDCVVDTESPIADVYSQHTSHLTDAQCAFFKKWEALISLEESEMALFRKELWTLGAAEREVHGRCFSNMVLDETYAHPPTAINPGTSKDTRIHRFTYRFTKSSFNNKDNLLNGHMSVGDAITISVEPHLLAVSRGFITELTPSTVVLGVDHEVSPASILSLLDLRGSRPPQIIFRIDKDELFVGMGRIRDNLAQLFYAGTDPRKLELIVDLAPPQFTENSPTAQSLSQPQLSRFSESLNSHQKNAIEKVLTAHDYALILGMPGTGKTTVIAAAIKTLVELGKTVLLTSYTHSAVDTIVLKLHDAEFNILRLGNIDKIHPDVQKYTLSVRKTATTIEQLEHQLMSPPVVRNPAARKGGLDASLFRRLSDAHPEAVVELAYQYRMNEDIMLLSNKLIYGDRLQCGSEAVAKRSLVVPNRAFLASIHGGKLTCHQNGCWIAKLLAQNCKAVFVDTDALPAHDSRVGNLVQNEVEATLVGQVVDAMLQSGIHEDQIGVISLYRQQIKLLSHLLHSYKEIEVLTADRSQGRDKDCIVISMVRSNDSRQIGDLLKDWRRINVSFTRARSKLIIFGSRKTLQEVPLLKEFFGLMENRGWILRLPPGATAGHPRLSRTPSPLKRPAEEPVGQVVVRDNRISAERPAKKAKAKARSSTADIGFLKGRPILIDLVNEDS